jgi:hypothetical protein
VPARSPTTRRSKTSGRADGSTGIYVGHSTARSMEMPDSVAVESKPGRGRCVVATRVLRPGEVVFFERPLAATLDPRHLGRACNYCFGPWRGVQAFICTGCKRYMCCSLSCTIALQHDSQECALLKNLPEQIRPEIIEVNQLAPSVIELSFARVCARVML